jgi:hypothetical protein
MVLFFTFFTKNGSDIATIYHIFSHFSNWNFGFITISLHSPPRFKEKMDFQKMPW